MQRIITTQIDYNPIKKEWTKYSVNGLECKRDEIYQFILDNQFYTGEIKLNKKYHFEQHEELVTEKKVEEKKEQHNSSTHTSNQTHTDTSRKTEDTTTDLNANFSLDTTAFVKKVDPSGEEYKLLINKMIHVLDMLYKAQQNHSKYSLAFRMAIVNCMRVVSEKITDYKAPYNNIMHKLSLEYTAFLFNMIAFGLCKSISKIDDLSGDLKLPALKFDLRGIKKQWDENWTNNKKSKFLDKYLAVLLKQADVVCARWTENNLFEDEPSQNVIQNNFSEFKKFIQSLQVEKLSLDVSLADIHDQSVSSKINSFFRVGKHHTHSNSSSKDTPVINSSPNNGY